MSKPTFSELPIIDAKKSIKLIITRADVAHADIKEPHNCAVARACRRELGAKEARIHLGRVYIRQNDQNWLRYETPKSLRAEIIAFDRGGKFEPGEFILPPPPKPTPAAKRGTRAVRGGHKQYRQKRHPVTNVRTGPAS